MNAEMRRLTADLGKRSSSEITEWLLARYPVGSADWGTALLLLDHVSVNKVHAKRLAEHYLSRIPYASDRPYRLFAKLLPLDDLIKILRQHLPAKRRDLDLLIYHVGPLIREGAGTVRREREMYEALSAPLAKD